MTFRDGGGVKVDYLPVVADFQPRFLEGGDGAPLLARLADLSGGTLPEAPPAS
jgi:hypothetical protein